MPHVPRQDAKRGGAGQASLAPPSAKSCIRQQLFMERRNNGMGFLEEGMGEPYLRYKFPGD